MASKQIPLITLAYVASAAIGKYRFVKIATSTHKVSQCADDEMAAGVALESAAADGDVITVGILGVFPVEAVEAIAAQLGISTGADGKAEKSEIDSPILGFALEDIAQDEVGMAFICPVKALSIAS